MNRRGFLKGMAGLASLPLVGKMATSMKSPMVREGIANVAGVVEDAPIYFWKLVDKIKNLGKDVTETASTLDTQKVKQYKDYELTEDLTTGQIEIQRTGRQSDDAYVNEQASEDVFMTYRPSEKILLDEANPAGGVRKTMPEYEEFTAYVSNNRGNTGEILEEVSGVPDDIFLEVGEQVPEFLRKGKAEGGIINLAGGGRVNFAKGGITKGLLAALKTIKSKYGKDSIKYLENEPDYGLSILNDYTIARPESAVLRDKMQNFGKPGKYNEDGSIDYDYYADLLNHSEDTVVYGDESIEELLAMEKRTLDEYAEMKDMYDTGKMDKYMSMEAKGQRVLDADDAGRPSGYSMEEEYEIREAMDEADRLAVAKARSKTLKEDFDIKQGDEDIDISQGMIDLDEMNFTKNAQAAKKAIDNASTNKEIKRGVGEIMSDTSPAALETSIEIDNLMLKYPGMDRRLAEQIATEINPRKKADIIAMVEQTLEMSAKGMSGDDIIQTFKNTPRTKQANGGIIGLTTNPRPANN